MRRKLINLPNENLRNKSKKVNLVDDKIKSIITDMESATIEWENSREHEVGVALAGIQIDELLRIVIIRNNFDNKEDKSFTVFLNPEITKLSGEIVEDFEGCLSIKDVYGRVPRYSKVKVKAMDIEGNVVRITAEGFLARVFQHEVDHTNGILFVDKIKDNPEAFFMINEKGKIQDINDEQRKDFFSILW